VTSTLRRLASGERPDPKPPAPERCEFCGADIDERHGHVADLVDHRLLCTCRACYLLFSNSGAGGVRYRGVGEDVRRVADIDLSSGQWDALRIPVDLAFFFRQSGQLLAFYPGPGGSTESELDLSAWADIESANPALLSLEPDVEAVLLRRRDDHFDCFLVPIDRCYELVGIVRGTWQGLGGGTEVWRHVDEFFANLDAA
jgi:hypothetical protein